jgi:hypothetical protein
MKWTKEKLGEIYFDKLGVTFTPEELDIVWNLRKSIDPIGSRPNIALTPIAIKAFVERELTKTGLLLSDARFKKVREEIIPAIDYALFLKKMGFGEHFICSSDSPDILLMKRENGSVGKRSFPVEVTFIKDFSVEGMAGSDGAEKLVRILEKNKLNKAYSLHTTLLVVIDTVFEHLDLEKAASLLKDKGKNFHEIVLWFNKGDEENYVMAHVYPTLSIHTLNPEKDLESLMY